MRNIFFGRSWAYKLSFLFLSLVCIIVLLIMLALSSVGTRFIIAQVNDADIGVSIQYRSGSLLSVLELNGITYEQAGVRAEIESSAVDIGWGCFLDSKVCVESLTADSVRITLLKSETAPEPPYEDTPNFEYIELPIAVSLDELRLNHFSLVDGTAHNDGSNESIVSEPTQKILELEDIHLDLNFFETLNINTLSIGQGDAFLPPTSEVEVENKAKKETKKDTPINREWLNNLATYEHQAFAIPQLFIPINASVRKFSLQGFCLNDPSVSRSHSSKANAANPAVENQLKSPIYCIDSGSIELSLQQQALSIESQVLGIADKRQLPLFSELDSELTASVDFANNYRHRVSLGVDLSNKDSSLLLTSAGTVKQSSLSLFTNNNANALLTAEISADIENPSLPAAISTQINEIDQSFIDTLSKVGVTLSDDVASQLSGVSKLALSLEGDMDEYSLEAELEAHHGAASSVAIEQFILAMKLRPESPTELMNIDKLVVNGIHGSASYRGGISVTKTMEGSTLSFQGKLDVEDLNVGDFTSELSGSVSGHVPHSIYLSETAFWGAIDGGKLSGEWQGLPFLLGINTAIQRDGTIKFKDFLLRQGQSNREQSTNSISVNGSLFSEKALSILGISQVSKSINKAKKYEQSSLKFDLDISDASLIYPAIEGQVQLNGNITGAIEMPAISFEGQGHSLSFANNSVSQFTLDGRVDTANELASTLHVIADNLVAADLRIPQLIIKLDGDSSAQNLSIALPEGEVQTEQVLTGALENTNGVIAWIGRWHVGRIKSEYAELELQSAPAIRLTQTPFNLSLENHCWEGRADRLCFGDTKVSESSASLSTDFSYNSTPLLAKFITTLKEHTSDIGVEGKAKVNWNRDDGTELSAQLSSSDIRLASDKNTIDIEQLEINLQGTPEKITTDLTLSSQMIGGLKVESQLEKKDIGYWHQGQIGVSELRLNELESLFDEVQRLQGSIQSSLRFEGPLVKPKLFGSLDVENASIGLRDVPMLLSNYNQSVSFDGYSASFDGRFTLREKLAQKNTSKAKLGVDTVNNSNGQAQIKGQLNYENQLAINASITGNELGVEYETYRFRVSPDMTIRFTPEQLEVSGAVAIPYARIKVKTLPKSAKSPSQDIVIVDQDIAQKQNSLPMNIDLNISIDDKEKGDVQVDALDLKAQLSGKLHLQVSNTNTQLNGLVQVLNGSYEAYGQVLQIRKGDITFNGQPEVPSFDIEAIRNPLNTADDVIAGIQVSGNALKPQVAIFSEPSMEQARQLSYLIGGTDIGSSSGGNSDSNTVLVNALVSYGVGKSENGLGGLGRNFGVEDLNLKTAGQGTDTKVQLSGQLAEGVEITYGIGVFESLSEVSVKYQLLPQLYLEAVSGATSTLDLYYQVTSRDD